MIPVNSRTLEEAEIIGGTVKLIEVDLWSPDKSGIKFVLSAANYHHETFEEWLCIINNTSYFENCHGHSQNYEHRKHRGVGTNT